MDDTALTLLAGLKATVGAMQAQIVALEAILGQPAAVSEPAGCRHEQTENQGTFGQPDWRCVGCGAKLDFPFSGDPA